MICSVEECGRIAEKRGGEGYVHQIICARFKGPAPTPEHEVAHGCGNPICINPRHIRWATPEENNADKIIHGTQFSKLTADAVLAIRASNETCSILGARYEVSPSTISNVRLRKVWDRSET